MSDGRSGRDREKAAIVTAAGSGIGAACARELAQRGYAVALMSTSGKAEALAKELGGIGLMGSVTEEAYLKAIVNVSTFSAFEPSPTFPLSSSLRAALAGFSKLYADRYAADGVRMNNVLPGYIESFEIDEETRGRYRCG